MSGSAQYVRQSDVLTTDETFTLAYKSTSFYNVLPVTAKKNFPKQCENKQATHVVSKVVYGQNAFYFFKRSVSRKERKEEIAGSLQVLVKSIPSFSIEGSATVKVDGEEKKFRESVQVRFNGDFKLPGGFPATFEEAVKSFKNLQSMPFFFFTSNRFCTFWKKFTNDRLIGNGALNQPKFFKI